MKSLFITDLELTGVTSSDAIIELAFLHIYLERDFYRPGMYYRRVFHYSFPPESTFAKAHHASLYDECRHADTAIPTEVQETILDYFKACGSTDWRTRMLIGSRLWLKLDALDRSRYLLKPQILDFETGPRQIGDYGSILDLYSVSSFIAEMFDDRRESVMRKLDALKLEALSPHGHKHRALFDCFTYLNRMNQYRMFMKSPWEFQNEGIFGKGSQVQQHVSSGQQSISADAYAR